MVRSVRPTWAHGLPLILPAMVTATSCGGSDQGREACIPDDADGLMGGDAVFELNVGDQGFSPAILTAQNKTHVTLTLHNVGTKPHDFIVDCIPTPNDDGCPMTSCFPAEANIAPLAPGTSATASFVVPNPEGIYYYHSDIAGDSAQPCTAGAMGCGQFIVK